MRTIGIALALVLGLTAAAQAQSKPNPSLAWGGVYKGPTTEELYLRSNQALIEHQLGKGGGVGGGGGTTVNGNLINHYHGPVSNSGSTVTNVGNLNETTTIIDANNSHVHVGNQTGQTANNANQSGAANANAATGDNAIQSGSAINQ